MREFIIILLCMICSINIICASTITGQVNKNETLSSIIDKGTGEPVKHAKIEIPQMGYMSYTDENGQFQLNVSIDKPLIMSIEKEGYRPFSITIDKNFANNPIKIGIEKTKIGDITISSNIYHLGDNVYSSASANCSQFKVKSIGPSYTKTFELEPLKRGESANIIIGSIIGLDTKLAKNSGQNGIEYAYSSPTEVFFNGQKISDIHLNGDNISIPIPASLIRKANQLTIKTGHNLFQRNYTDYDDIEIMNISIQTGDSNYDFAQK